VKKNIIKNKNLIERHVRDQWILVPLKTAPARLDALYTLNSTAGFIWKAIDDYPSENALIDRLVATYEVDEPKARKDVERILMELASIDAITISS